MEGNPRLSEGGCVTGRDTSIKLDRALAGSGPRHAVRQAVQYLGVGQPTIFRWMKEGLLSFQAAGGSTRFSQEGLEAVIEETRGRKEAEAAAGRCAACGIQRPR